MTTEIINATTKALKQNALARVLPDVATAVTALSQPSPQTAAVAALPIISDGLAKLVSNPLASVTGPLTNNIPTTGAPASAAMAPAQKFAMDMMERAQPGSVAALQQNLSRKRVRDNDVDDLLQASTQAKKQAKQKDDPDALQGANDLQRLERMQRQKQLDDEADQIRIMLPKMARNPRFKKDIEDAGLAGKLTATAVQSLDTEGVFRLQKNLMLALKTELDTSPITAGLNLITQAVELGSLVAYQNWGWVPLIGLSEDIRTDENILKSAEMLAYEWMSYMTMDPKTNLLLSLPSKIVSRYTQNRNGLNDESKDVPVPQEVVQHFADL